MSYFGWHGTPEFAGCWKGCIAAPEERPLPAGHPRCIPAWYCPLAFPFPVVSRPRPPVRWHPASFLPRRGPVPTSSPSRPFLTIRSLPLFLSFSPPIAVCSLVLHHCFSAIIGASSFSVAPFPCPCFGLPRALTRPVDGPGAPSNAVRPCLDLLVLFQLSLQPACVGGGGGPQAPMASRSVPQLPFRKEGPRAPEHCPWPHPWPLLRPLAGTPSGGTTACGWAACGSGTLHPLCQP